MLLKKIASKIIFLLFFSVISTQVFSRIEYGLLPSEQETVSWAFEKAQHFSGINSKSSDNWKRIHYYLLTESELSLQVCPNDPQNCHGLAAVYDTKTNNIYIRENVNPELNIVNLSFLVHEFVHSLQHEYRTEDEMFGTCGLLFNTESVAYLAQDNFLKSEGQFFRAGNALRFFLCN